MARGEEERRDEKMGREGEIDVTKEHKSRSRRVKRAREEERYMEDGAGGARERAAGIEGW